MVEYEWRVDINFIFGEGKMIVGWGREIFIVELVFDLCFKYVLRVVFFLNNVFR